MPKRVHRDPNRAAFDLLKKVIAKSEGHKKASGLQTAKKKNRRAH